MSDPVTRHVSPGNRTDYVLGIAQLGWSAFDVVRFHAIERISELFRYDITLVRAANEGPADLDALVDASCTLAIASERRWRLVHGIIADAQRLERTNALILYRVLLVPHFWRARYRHRCRNFVDKNLKDILDGVLRNVSDDQPNGANGLSEQQGDPQPPPGVPDFNTFREPHAVYRWHVSDDTRLRHAELRSYVVQYNESDFDFLCRHLEEEGISFFFEHTADSLLLTLTDNPRHAPLFMRDESYTMRSLASGMGDRGDLEVIRSFAARSSLRPSSVTMRDFAWPRSRSLLQATASMPALTAEAPYFEYPARDEALCAESSVCRAPATVRMERFEAEQRMSVGTGTVRTMESGRRFRLRDEGGLYEEDEHLIVSVETYASQLEVPDTVVAREPFGFDGAAPAISYVNRFEMLPSDIRFRPALVTRRPRIDGIQTALVTAEEFAEGSRPEINTDEHARVRVRFPWDQSPDDGTPSSAWIRVAQYWAGPSYGALYTPRVGHEVIVSYLQGDPDRPVIVGRVYNVQAPPPFDPSQHPERSTLKSDSSPNDDTGFNEFQFEDKTGQEEIYLHAQRNLREVVRNDHSTNVGHDQTNHVRRHQSNHVEGDRKHVVEQEERVIVVGDRRTEFKSNETHLVTLDRATEVSGMDRLTVSDHRQVWVTGHHHHHVFATSAPAYDWLKVDGARLCEVRDRHTFKTEDHFVSEARNNHNFRSSNFYIRLHTDFQVINDDNCFIRANGGHIQLSNGSGARINLGPGNRIQLDADYIRLRARHIVLVSDENTEIGAGTNVDVLSGSEVNIDATTDVNINCIGS